MISAQNHLLPLNGSKWLLFLLINVLVVACKSSQVVSQLPVTVEPLIIEEVIEENSSIIVKQNDTKKAEEVVLTKIKPVKDSVITETDKNIKKDTELDVLLILPFDVTKYPEEVLDITTIELSANTKIASEFYSGVKMALDELQNANYSVKLQVFDNALVTDKTVKILNGIKDDVDVIIGPVYNKELREASEIAKRKKIPVVSPLSSSTTIATQNPYYYSANASGDMHMEKIVSYILNGSIDQMVDRSLYNHVRYDLLNSSKKVNIIHFSDASELNTISSIKRIIAGRPSTEKDLIQTKDISISLETELNTLKSKLDSTQHNFVILPLYSESNILHALNLLSQLNNYSMTVFGMSTWRKFDKINYEYLNTLKVFITNSYFIDKSNSKVIEFIKSYREKYRATPGEYVFQGYDLIQYLVHNFKDGQLFKARSESYSFSNYLHTQFEFVPRFDKSNFIEFYDNKFVHLLQFDNYLYKKVE